MQPTEMSTPESMKSNAKAVGALLCETGRPSSNWSGTDYGPLLAHQLKASVQQDIGRRFGGVEHELSGIGPMTFGELFERRSPPLAALKLAKDFAKHLERHAREAYPPAVATALYFAAIAAARRHAGASISSLPAKELLNGFEWASSQPWLPDTLRRLFAEALRAPDPPRETRPTSQP